MLLATRHRDALLGPEAAVPAALETIVSEVEGTGNDGVVVLECLRGEAELRFVGLLWRLGPVGVDLIVVELGRPGEQIAWGGSFENREAAERAWRRGRMPAWSHVVRGAMA